MEIYWCLCWYQLTEEKTDKDFFGLTKTRDNVIAICVVSLGLSTACKLLLLSRAFCRHDFGLCWFQMPVNEAKELSLHAGNINGHTSVVQLHEITHLWQSSDIILWKYTDNLWSIGKKHKDENLNFFVGFIFYIFCEIRTYEQLSLHIRVVLYLFFQGCWWVNPKETNFYKKTFPVKWYKTKLSEVNSHSFGAIWTHQIFGLCF